MQHITFTVRTLTPLFLAGVDPTRAEIRAPSFRGLMRYWYRALIGGIIGTSEQALNQIMKQESAIFGATDTGSAITVQVSEASRKAQSYRKEGSREDASGKDYFLWSMARSRDNKNGGYKPDRCFFPAGTTFQVSLSSHGESDVELRQAVNAFWLLTHLGGIGARSRRCAGSLEAEITDSTLQDLGFERPQTSTDLQEQLHKGIIAIRKSALKYIHPKEVLRITQSSFDILAQPTCQVWLLYDKTRCWTTTDEAMRALGQSLQTYRSSLSLAEREVFGLPLKPNLARLASPLLLRISEVQQEGYVGIAVLFKTGDMAPYQRIEDWINRFSGKDQVTF